MSGLQACLSFLGRYKCIIVLAVFVFIIVFVDENSALRRIRYSKEIGQLKNEIKKYQAEYDESTRKLNELNTNPEAIEQIAREKYLMKKSNEDIYVFED